MPDFCLTAFSSLNRDLECGHRFAAGDALVIAFVIDDAVEGHDCCGLTQVVCDVT